MKRDCLFNTFFKGSLISPNEDSRWGPQGVAASGREGPPPERVQQQRARRTPSPHPGGTPPKASQQPAIHRAVLPEPRPATMHPDPPRPSHAPVPTPPSAGGRGPAAAWDVCGPGSLPVLSKSSSSSKASLDAPRPVAPSRMPTESDMPLLSPLPHRGSGAFRGSPLPGIVLRPTH